MLQHFICIKNANNKNCIIYLHVSNQDLIMLHYELNKLITHKAGVGFAVSCVIPECVSLS